MNKLKLLFFVLLLSVGVSASAAIKVVFLNGIDGYDEKNDASKAKLAEIMKKAGYGVKLSVANVEWKYWSNPGDGFFSDKLELLAQAKVSGEALTLARISNPSADAQSKDYYDILGNLYAAQINSGAAKLEGDQHIYSVVRDLSTYITREILTKNNQIIIVSHSQGNFFAEAVAAYLTVSKSAAENKKFDDNLRFVGVASVAASTPQYRYISAYEDKALFGHVAATSLVWNFSILPLNVKFCVTLDAACVPKLQATVDPTIHGFQETYTSDLIDKNTGEPIYKLLAKHVIDSFDELNRPTAASPALDIFKAGLYEASTDGQCYYKASTGTLLAAGEYRLATSRWCLNSARSAWALQGESDSSKIVMSSSGAWSSNAPSILSNADGTVSLKYGANVVLPATFTTKQVSGLPSGSIEYTWTFTNTYDWFEVFSGTSAAYENAAFIDALLTKWSANGSAYLEMGSQYAWAFAEYAAGSDSGLVSYFDPTVSPRSVVATGTWNRMPLPSGNDGIKLNTPAGLIRENISGDGGSIPFYVRRPSSTGDTGVREGLMHTTGATKSMPQFNRTAFDAWLRSEGLPATAN